MSSMKSGFVTLTLPTSNGSIAVRADRVVIVEECGDNMRLVALDNSESFMCTETVDEIVSAIDAATN